MIIRKAWGMAQRGRYINEHKPGAPTKQRFEVREKPEISNAITSIQKDYLVFLMIEDEEQE